MNSRGLFVSVTDWCHVILPPVVELRGKRGGDGSHSCSSFFLFGLPHFLQSVWRIKGELDEQREMNEEIETRRKEMIGGNDVATLLLGYPADSSSTVYTGPAVPTKMLVYFVPASHPLSSRSSIFFRNEKRHELRKFHSRKILDQSRQHYLEVG